MKRYRYITVILLLIAITVTSVIYIKAEDEPEATDYQTAVEILRNGMAEREEIVTLTYIKYGEYDDGLGRRIYDDAQKHTGCPKEGDYIKYNLVGAKIKTAYTGNKTKGYFKYTIEYEIEYHTGKAEEKYVDEAINDLLYKLNLYEENEYIKVRTVYSWMCENIAYDYKNLKDDSNYKKYSAYAALHDRACVCQGYSLLFYRIMLELGVETRVIMGTCDTAHSWNTVRLEDKFYYVDVTFDSDISKSPDIEDWNFFLKGTDSIFSKETKILRGKTYYLIKPHIPNGNGMQDSSGQTYKVSESDFLLSASGFTGIFADVPFESWYYREIKEACQLDLMKGTSDVLFSPMSTTNRAMIATILYRIEGEPETDGELPFSDCEKVKGWAGDAILWAYNNGITKGTSDDLFSPQSPVTREQIASMLYRYAGYKGYDTDGEADVTYATDYSEISEWALKPVSWAVWHGFITGTSTKEMILSPHSFAKRCETAAMFNRFYKFVQEEAEKESETEAETEYEAESETETDGGNEETAVCIF